MTAAMLRSTRRTVARHLRPRAIRRVPPWFAALVTVSLRSCPDRRRAGAQELLILAIGRSLCQALVATLIIVPLRSWLDLAGGQEIRSRKLFGGASVRQALVPRQSVPRCDRGSISQESRRSGAAKFWEWGDPSVRR